MGAATLQLDQIFKSYGPVRALAGLTLDVQEGELLSLVGPSGSGKTTALHLIAGLMQPDQGDIRLCGKSLIGLRPKDREVAMVFQDGALYPHLTVAQNLAFPLRARGRRGAKAVPKMAERLGILNLLGRYPSELSGGEARRVALGRALIRKPRLFLLDEPLAGLDVPMRERLRSLILELVRETEVATLCVTHEQNDAMVIGDRVAVLREGRLVQCDTPRQIYSNPSSEFVARFFGSPSMNFLSGTLQNGSIVGPWGKLPVAGARQEREAIAGFRPENVLLHDRADGIPGVLSGATFFGHETVAHLALEDGSEVRVRIPANGAVPKAGANLRFSVLPDGLLLFDPVTGNRL